LAFATFLVWRLRTGACGVGACGFWRYRMPPKERCPEDVSYHGDVLQEMRNEVEKLDKDFVSIFYVGIFYLAL